MPDSHKNPFAPRVFGFPASAKGQLEEYAVCPRLFDLPALGMDPEHNQWLLDEKVSQTDDVDRNGKILETPKLLQRFEQVARKNVVMSPDPEQPWVPVTKLKRHSVDNEVDMPRVRVLRHTQVGLVFKSVTTKVGEPRARLLPTAEALGRIQQFLSRITSATLTQSLPAGVSVVGQGTRVVNPFTDVGVGETEGECQQQDDSNNEASNNGGMELN